MTSFTNTKQKIDANDKDKRNTLVTIFLIIILLSIILFSVIIFKNFSFSSANVKPSEKTYEMQFLELDQQSKQTDTTSKEITPTEPEQTPATQTLPQTTTQSPPQTIPVTPSPTTAVQTPVQTKPVTSQPSTKTTITPSVKTTTPVTSTTKKVSSSENRVGVDGKYVTSQNIRKYHDVLLKEFSGITIMDYKIVWGDTLWKIALRNNTSAHTLYVLNALENPDLIISGENLKVVKNFILPKTKTKSIIEEQMKIAYLLNKNQNLITLFGISENMIRISNLQLLSGSTLFRKNLV